MENLNNILIVGSHFDDAELGVGGAAARLAEQGKNVYKLTLTDNETHSERLKLKIDYESSKSQSAQACNILGVKEIDFAPVKCSRLRYDKEIMQRVEAIIFERHIDTVFMHFMDDSNQDHVEASRICKTAARHCQNLLAYQSNLYVTTIAFHPTFYVDISGYIGKKEAALARYQGHHNRFDRLFETTLMRNRTWGYSQKVEYAEAFQVIKLLY